MSTQVAALTRVPLITYTRWALAVTAAAMPLYVVRWHVGPLPTTLLENLILITVALYALTLWRHGAPLPRRTPYEIPIALFFVAGVIGIFVAPDHRGALGIFRAYILEPIAMYYVAIAALGSIGAIESLLAAWAVGAVLLAIDEVVVFIRALSNATLTPGHAAAAFDINPNSVAIYLEPLIGLAVGFALFACGRRRWAAIATVAILFLAELATLSRGGLLALAALGVVAILTVRSVRLRIALVIAAAVGAGMVRLLPVVGPRAANALNPATGTLFGRISIWLVSVRMLREHPVFGAGLNAYQTTVAPYRAADPNLPPGPYPHNIFLATWSELGLLGLTAFVYILANLVVRPWRAFSCATDFQRPFLWGVGAAFVMITVHGLVDTPYWKNDLSLEFWLLAALEVVALRAVSRSQSAND